MRGRRQRADPALAPAHERGVRDAQGGRRRDRHAQRVRPRRPAQRHPAGGQFGEHVRGDRQHGPTGSPDPRPAPGTATSVTLPTGGVLLQQDQSALLTGPAPELVLSGLTRSLASGPYVRVLFTFQKAGTVSLTLPVIARSDSYATFSPAPTADAHAQRHREAPPSRRGVQHGLPVREQVRYGHPDPHRLT